MAGWVKARSIVTWDARVVTLTWKDCERLLQVRLVVTAIASVWGVEHEIYLITE